MLVQELNLTMEFHAVSEPGTFPWSLWKWSSTHAPYAELGALSVTAEFPFMARTTPGFVLDTSTAGSQTSEQPAYTTLNHDFERHADHYHGQDFFPPSRGYNSRAPDLPSASSQFSVSPRGDIDPLTPGSTVYPVVYTGATRVKLTRRVRRRCSTLQYI